MTDLTTLVESLKRAVAVPGAFADTFPQPQTADLVGALADGFAEAQMWGFFTPNYGGVSYTLDLTAHTITPAVNPGQGALIVIFAASRFVQAFLMNLKNRQKFAAKGADYETEQSANVLTTLLKQFDSQKQTLVQRATYAGYASAFHMADGYFMAATQQYYPNGYGGTPYTNADPAGF